MRQRNAAPSPRRSRTLVPAGFRCLRHRLCRRRAAARRTVADTFSSPPCFLPACTLQTTRGSYWRTPSWRSTTTTPAALAMRSCIGAGRWLTASNAHRSPCRAALMSLPSCRLRSCRIVIGWLLGHLPLSRSSLCLTGASLADPLSAFQFHPNRNAYNMVVNKYGDRLYRGLVDTETQHLRRVGGWLRGCVGQRGVRLVVPPKTGSEPVDLTPPWCPCIPTPSRTTHTTTHAHSPAAAAGGGAH